MEDGEDEKQTVLVHKHTKKTLNQIRTPQFTKKHTQLKNKQYIAIYYTTTNNWTKLAIKD